MLNQIRFLLKFIQYYFSARYSKGHGIHSPFVYQFVQKVLFAKEDITKYAGIFGYFKKLRENKAYIEINDFGAGSHQFTNNKRQISSIALCSSTKKKYGKLLTRLVEYYKPLSIIELGTSVGIGTSYLALNKLPECKLYTIEGTESLVSFVNNNCHLIKNSNVIPLKGNFDLVLPDLLNRIETVDLVYVDGNHRKDATLKYFEYLLPKLNNNSILIFDDIHWSKEMEDAWKCIKLNKNVKLCIDIFQMGIVFFRKELSREYYRIRF